MYILAATFHLFHSDDNRHYHLLTSACNHDSICYSTTQFVVCYISLNHQQVSIRARLFTIVPELVPGTRPSNVDAQRVLSVINIAVVCIVHTACTTLPVDERLKRNDSNL